MNEFDRKWISYLKLSGYRLCTKNVNCFLLFLFSPISDTIPLYVCTQRYVLRSLLSSCVALSLG